MKEDIFNKSKRIDDPKMAEEMAIAGHELRTSAAEARGVIKEREALKTEAGILGNLFHFLTRNKARRMQDDVSFLDASADMFEDLAKIKYLARDNAKYLNNEQLQSLLDQMSLRLESLVEGKEEEELDKETIELGVIFTELYKIFKQRTGFIN